MKYFALLFILFLGISSYAQIIPITEIQGESSHSPYDGFDVTTKGIVTATFTGGYFLQDGDAAWSAIYVYDEVNNPEPGDSLNITGMVKEYYDLTEISDLTDFTVINQGNPLPEPIVINTGDASEQWESVFVKYENATCTNPDIGYGEWEVDDGSGPASVGDLGVSYSPMAGMNYHISGPLYYSYGTFKIEPRSESDIQVADAVYFSQPFAITDIQETSITFEWETNTAATTEISYGLTEELELGTESDMTNTTSHAVTLEGLSANEIYYVKPYSVAGDDTTTSMLHRAATASTSTGAMKVWFNHSVDTSVAWNQHATAAPGAFTDTIISYIEKAQSTLDITMYDVVDTTENKVIDIINAINTAWDNGVTVRYITDDEPENPLLDSLHPDIPVLEGNSGDPIMHDKFIIIDAGSITNSWVMTGSTNHTMANLQKDYNNLICIQDHQLAKAYTAEFNEMWGSSDITPNPDEALFGADKTDNTPHQFNIAGTRVECFFSPSDQTSDHIISTLNKATTSVYFGVLVFTETTLGNAVLDAYNRGLEVKGIIDYTQYGNVYGSLNSNGVNVLDYVNEDGSEWPEGATFHHKYAIIDQATADAALITGSHNWSASAESRNDENTLIIHDRNIANLYYQEFSMRWAEQLALASVQQSTEVTFDVYPNPSANRLHVELQNSNMSSYTIYNLQGQVLQQGKLTNIKTTIQHDLRPGLYVIQVRGTQNQHQLKFVVE